MFRIIAAFVAWFTFVAFSGCRPPKQPVPPSGITFYEATGVVRKIDVADVAQLKGHALAFTFYFTRCSFPNFYPRRAFEISDFRSKGSPLR